jgi:GR25 family glycosyltransferase involved in LPS biosynthesis
MNIAYKLFHLPRDHDRNKLVENAHSVLLKNIKILDTDTIKVSSYDDYVKFKDGHPDFNININGYNLHNEQGWRYGEVGIWASNWLAWKNFINSDYDYLILMEDDIVIYDNFFEKINTYIKECPEDFDALHIFSPTDQDYKYNILLNVSENICSSYQDWSCACYIINKGGAKRMLDLSSKGINLPLDWFMFRQKNLLNVYTINPNISKICTIEEVESTFQLKEDRKILNGIL